MSGPGSSSLIAPREPAKLRAKAVMRPAAGFLPKEHGSWSLALEPLALGLMVAPSSAGLALTLAAVAGFFARRPFKASLTPEATPRCRAAYETVAMFSVFAIAGLIECALLGGLSALRPLLLAAPCGGLFVYFDAQNDSRAAAAELSGSAAFAILPVACATLAGWSWSAALALGALALARSLPTVLTVRTCLRRSKGQSVRPALPLLVAMIALVAVGWLSAQNLVPETAVLLVALLFLRTLFFIGPFRPAWSARRFGIFEAILGVVFVVTLALAYHFTHVGMP